MALGYEVGPATMELYRSLGPWMRADELDSRFELLELCEAIMGRLQPIEDLVRDSDDGPGWSSIMDLTRAPASWLGWLAQFVGVRLRVGLTDVAQRARIVNTDGFRRGSPAALEAAARQYLVPLITGDPAYVVINERAGSAYRLGVLTKLSETPDEDAVRAALLEQKPAGIVLDYVVVAGNSYAALSAAFDDYAGLDLDYATYLEVQLNPPSP